MAKKAVVPVNEVGKVLEMMRENAVEYVDLRFTDPRGKWQHTAQHISTIDEDAFRDGIMFDGSSIAGWKATSSSRPLGSITRAIHGRPPSWPKRT